jgi:hypothetical protein
MSMARSNSGLGSGAGDGAAGPTSYGGYDAADGEGAEERGEGTGRPSGGGVGGVAAGNAAGGPPELANVFGLDTEAGRLLLRLYGRPRDKAVVAPKPRRLVPLAQQGPRPQFRRTMAHAEAADPHAATFNRAAALEVDAHKPPPGGLAAPARGAAPVDLLPTRKSKAAIDAAAAWEAAHGDKALPPLRKGRNTEAEKHKLQTIFNFKGGKGLPASALADPLPGNVPLHLLRGGGGGAGRVRGGGGADDAASQAGAGVLSWRAEGAGGVTPRSDAAAPDALAREAAATLRVLAAEVDDRRAWLGQMRQLGQASAEVERRMAAEIADRGREMARLQAMAAGAGGSAEVRASRLTAAGGRAQLGGAGSGSSPARSAAAGGTAAGGRRL